MKMASGSRKNSNYGNSNNIVGGAIIDVQQSTGNQNRNHNNSNPSAENNPVALNNYSYSNTNNNIDATNDTTTGAVGSSMQSTPLFERLVTEDVQELKAYVRIVESQTRKLAELERVHADLENRLEIESRGRQQLETTLEAREREWNKKLEHLLKDRDYWKTLVSQEQLKNSRLIDQVVRKDQDIHRMLQRKYDHENLGRSVRNVRHALEGSGSSSGKGTSRSPDLRGTDSLHKSPHQILAASGSQEKIRVKNAHCLLLDFFGM